ncbi:MAG: DUF6624 domain-containing protein [Sphingomicrobium sp.]
MKSSMLWMALPFGVPASASTAPAPPSVLAPYVVNGRFEARDLNWVRGAFPEASAAEKAAYEQVNQWRDECAASDRTAVLNELAAMGVAVDQATTTTPRDPLCASLMMPDLRQFKSFAELQAADVVARPISESFLYAVKLAEESSLPTSLSEALRFRTQSEQMLRKAVFWGEGSQNGAPPLAPLVKAVVESRLGVAMGQRDRVNTEWLKKIVKAEGWPKISVVGKEASQSAWLLVQHADADPPFQLHALRLMDRLVATGEVDKSNYAYLYDRVMLKVSGIQRYGTQMTCRGGKRVPQPLESESTVESRRSELGLTPMSEYMALMQSQFGDCPPDRR